MQFKNFYGMWTTFLFYLWREIVILKQVLWQKEIVQEPFYALLDKGMLMSLTSESDADTSSSP